MSNIISFVDAFRSNASFCNITVTGVSQTAQVGSLLLRVFDETASGWQPSQVLFRGRPSLKQTINSINYGWVSNPTAFGTMSNNFSLKIYGYIQVPTSDTYTFQATVDDGVRMWINGIQILQSWQTQGPTPYTGSIYLVANAWYPIYVEHYQGFGGQALVLQYRNTTTQTAYTLLQHGSNMNFAYDDDEKLPSMVGSALVQGVMSVGGAPQQTTTPLQITAPSQTALYAKSTTTATEVIIDGNTSRGTIGVDSNLYFSVNNDRRLQLSAATQFVGWSNIPVQMTANTTNVDGYTFVASASSGATTAFNAFRQTTDNNGTTTSWVSASNYGGTLATTNTGLGAISGEWLQIQFPSHVSISQYVISAATTASNVIAAPQSWTLAGSLDGANWLVFDQRSNVTFTTGSKSLTYNVVYTIPSILYMRLILQSSTATSVAINNLVFPFPSNVTTISPTNWIGVGTTNPPCPLFIDQSPGTIGQAGSVVFAMQNKGFNGDNIYFTHDGFDPQLVVSGADSAFHIAMAPNQNIGAGPVSRHVSITPSGRVGIGASSPATTLDVNGTSTFRDTATFSSNITFASSNAVFDVTSTNLFRNNTVMSTTDSYATHNGNHTTLTVTGGKLVAGNPVPLQIYSGVNNNNGCSLFIGKDAGNGWYLEHQHIGHGSTSNTFTIGAHGRGRQFNFSAGGGLGIGLTNPGSNQLQLSGDLAAKSVSSTWNIGSDQRIKTDIQTADIDRCYSVIENLDLKYYSYTQEFMDTTSNVDRHRLGWIAQEVEAVFPKAVTVSDQYGLTDFKSLNTDQIYAALYGTIKKIQNIVDVVDQRISSLEALPR
jgi:hypothetical protein